MAHDSSVTVVVTRRVKPGKENEYQRWFDEVTKLSKPFPGHLGATLQGPGDNNEYNIIFRYDSIENLRRWDESRERAQWTKKLDDLVEGKTSIDRYTGLEFLFDSSAPPIPKYRMVIVLTIVVYSMILLLTPIVAFFSSELVPRAVQLLITVAIQIVLMTYLVMPWITRIIGRFLRT